ncbi:MAG: solute carrier family 23 protein [Peptoniphilus sp.]|uniref:uracil-xanthine permease family protein n=1 Tax=Peptoniphilus sp. TaxID=1971214 RepID=UPI002A74D346|nr:solute carrier family 23 protein [Peptoniphilus sp.]MDY2986791.1 solute carrier family 23 protein [Peptoniphilus sp.]
MEKNVNRLSDKELIYQLDGKPSLKVAFPIGFQHVLAMFAGNLAPVLILIGVLGLNGTELSLRMIQCAMFVSGLTTFIQLYPIKIGKFQIGAGLPIVMGTSFAFVSTAASIGGEYSSFGPEYALSVVLGAACLGSMVEVIIGLFYKQVKGLFPPLVVGSVLITMGVKLLGVGVNYFAGGVGAEDFGSAKNLALGFLVFFVITFLQRFGKGMWKISSILVGLIIGYIVAAFIGKVDFTPVMNANVVGAPLPIIKPWELKFPIGAVISFATIYIVSGLETIGNSNGITIAGFNREATAEETSGAILADALGSTVAVLFNALPNTAFGQNAGIVAMTKVVNKWCVAMGAFVLMASAFLPKVGMLFNIMPNSVLGGAVITVFSMIMINGIKMITKAGFSDRNIIVLGITFGLGLGLGSHPEALVGLPPMFQFIFKDTVACVCIISILANIIFPPTKEDKKMAEQMVKEGDN